MPNRSQPVSDSASSHSPGDPFAIEHLTQQLNVVDALLFRRISDSTWAHLGGFGRGNSWAGIIEIDTTTDPLAQHVPAEARHVSFLHFPGPERIVGPYYAQSAALARISHDVVVVLGNPAATVVGSKHDFLALGDLVNTSIDEVRPAKRLADELEMLHTVRDILSAPTDLGLDATLEYLLHHAVSALSCDIGALRRGNRKLITSANCPTATTELWQTILDEIASSPPQQADPEVWMAQDRDEIPSETLRNMCPDVVSLMALTVPTEQPGMLLVMHTGAEPRGFSGQCVILGGHIVETGLIVARTAAMRDELRRSAEQAAVDARTDPLTGLGNRLAWDEALAAAEHRVDAGEPYSVITVDIDGLKDINDAYGHAAGDQLLRDCADLIRKHCSESDVAVRLGGDEFAVLVPHIVDQDSTVFAAFSELVNAPRSTQHQVAASVGIGTANPGSSLSDAARDADMAMYQNKQARRAFRAGELPGLEGSGAAHR